MLPEPDSASSPLALPGSTGGILAFNILPKGALTGALLAGAAPSTRRSDQLRTCWKSCGAKAKRLYAEPSISSGARTAGEVKVGARRFIPGDKPRAPWRCVFALKKTLPWQPMCLENWEPRWKSRVKAGLVQPWARGDFQPGVLGGAALGIVWTAIAYVPGTSLSAWTSVGLPGRAQGCGVGAQAEAASCRRELDAPLDTRT